MINGKIATVVFALLATVLFTTVVKAEPVDQAATARAEHLYDALAVEHVPVDIANYYAAYKSNKLSADKRFLGHWNMFVGTVSNVSRDHDGKAYISLVADAYGIATVKVYPSPKQLRRAADGVVRNELTDTSLMALSTGISLSLQCKGDENEFGRPVLSECLFWDYSQLVSMMKSS
jgi:hypothetical protein